MHNGRRRFSPLVILLIATGCSSGNPPADASPAADSLGTSEAVAAPDASPDPTRVPSTGEPTEADFINHLLTMDQMRKWADVTKRLSAYSGTAADTAAMRTIRISTDLIAVTERKINAIERMKQIFDEAGLTPREYHMITGAYGVSTLPTSRNAEFIKANRTELDALMAKLKMSRR